MDSILDQIMASKRAEVAAARMALPWRELQQRCRDLEPRRDFAQAIRQQTGVSLIAEVKRQSPSKGLIRADFEPVTIARTYADHGATCLSVLTDGPYFGGHLSYLAQIRQAVSLPLLRKDFIIDTYQLWEALDAGADAVLLIAECLPDEQLPELHQQALELGLTPLVELYAEENLPRVMALNPVMIGVNNRDLHTFAMDLGRSLRLRGQVPPDVLFVSESGIESPHDVRRLADCGVDAMLVGESLMRQNDIGLAVRNLLSQTH